MLPKILVIRFSSIGDIVLCSPVFRCIKKQLPDAELHFVTKLAFKAVTENNPNIDRFFYYQDNLKELTDELSKEQYDFVIDLHNNIRSNTLKRALGRKTYTINKLTFRKFLLTKLKLNFMPGRHITLRSLGTLKALGVKDDGFGLDYFIPEKDIVPQSDIPASHSAGYIAIVIGANYVTKKLPIPKLKELCQKINHPVILLGGEDCRAEGEEIASVDPVKIYNSCGKFNLNESADLIRKSKLVVSHDTGLQYIACAFNKPVIAIWGGTSPKLDVEPYYGSATRNQLHENIVLNLWCQPCSKYGTNTCPLGHFNCMKKQDIDFIVGRVNDWLAKK
ncbi:MAG: glycosyltransferase family 9 protein [Ferruginibacter sp.]|nr:glycosyltransferase family 9 protein [Ferruginibacter sp.]